MYIDDVRISVVVMRYFLISIIKRIISSVMSAYARSKRMNESSEYLEINKSNKKISEIHTFCNANDRVQ